LPLEMMTLFNKLGATAMAAADKKKVLAPTTTPPQ
jgi:hypothetical protein